MVSTTHILLLVKKWTVYYLQNGNRIYFTEICKLAIQCSKCINKSANQFESNQLVTTTCQSLNQSANQITQAEHTCQSLVKQSANQITWTKAYNSLDLASRTDRWLFYFSNFLQLQCCSLVLGSLYAFIRESNMHTMYGASGIRVLL